VQQVLGRGSSGVVYSASLWGIPLALKVTAPGPASDDGDKHQRAMTAASSRLEAEAELLKRLPPLVYSNCAPALVAHGLLVDSDGVQSQFLAETRMWGRPILEAVGFLPSSSAHEVSLAAFDALARLHKQGVAQVWITPLRGLDR
jgi:hypothetical protein